MCTNRFFSDPENSSALKNLKISNLLDSNLTFKQQLELSDQYPIDTLTIRIPQEKNIGHVNIEEKIVYSEYHDELCQHLRERKQLIVCLDLADNNISVHEAKEIDQAISSNSTGLRDVILYIEQGNADNIVSLKLEKKFSGVRTCSLSNCIML